MSILWKSWSTVSAGVTRPGSPVTGIAWGNNVTIFSALSNSHVAQNEANPFANPVWPNWAFTDGPAIPVPQILEGAPVAAVGFGNRTALFATDKDGTLWQNIGDPAAINWDGWSQIALAISVPSTPVSAIAWGNSVAIFLVDRTGPKQNLGDPNQKNWGICTLIPGVNANPGSNITALPWGNRVALFLADQTGTVYQNIGYPQIDNWAGWTPISGLTTTPGAQVTAQIWGNGIILFVTDADGVLHQSVGDPNSATSWQSSTLLPQPPVPATAGTPITTTPIGNQLAIFVGDRSGSFHMTLGTPQTNSWAAWASVGQGGFAPGGPITAVPWIGGMPALFAVDNNGAIWSTSPYTVPAAPTRLVLDGLTSGDGEIFADLAWDDNINTDPNYPVSYSVVFTGRTVARPPVSGTIDNGEDKTLEMLVAQNFTYTFFVEARNAAGVSGPSNSLSVVVPKQRRPSS